jgi:aryl-alcohol dehydrogenase-like predicted oxidoreductase
LLQRNYVDIYLLHECRAADLDNDELFDFLGAQRAKGLIRAFGIGTDIATVVHSARSAPNFAHVVQFANNPQEPNLERSPALASEHACITHTPFGGVGQTAHIESGSALQYAARHNPNGIILFGSQSEGHIASNVRAFT